VTRSCPESVAVTDRVWFSHGCGFGWEGGIGRVDVTSAPPTVTLGHEADRYYQPPRLDTARNATVLVATDGSVSPSDTDVYAQAADGSLVRKVSRDGIAGSDLVLSPDGTSLYVGPLGRFQLQSYAVGDLSPVRTFDTEAEQVALSPNGAEVAAGFSAGAGAQVSVFTTSDGVRQVDHALGAGTSMRDLGWARTDSRYLYAVTVTSDWQKPQVPTLHLLQVP
jgi:hypothetical protein